MKKRKTFFRIFDYMKGVKMTYIIGILGLAVLAFLIQTLLAYMFLNLFDSLQTETFQSLLDGIIIYIMLILIIFMIFPFFSYLAMRATVITTGNIRKDLFSHLSLLPLSFHKAHHSAETISKATNDVGELEKAYTEHLSNFIINLMTGIGTSIVMFLIDYRLALIAMGAALITLYVNTLYAKRLRKISTEVQERLATVNTRLSNILAGVHVIRMFNIQQLILKKFIKSNEATLRSSKRRIAMQANINGLNELVGFLSFAGMVIVGSYFVLIGTATVGVIIAVVQLQNGVNQFVRMLGTFVTNLQGSLAAGDRVFALLDEDKEPITYVTQEEITHSKAALSFENVSFGYDDTTILNRLNFDLKQHQTVAIVGPSGGGKSTLFKLALAFYEPHQGHITIDGKSPFIDTLKTIRKSIAYVPQDAFLFNATVKENIAYGNLDATEDMIIDAAKAANAHAFIETLDQGYETMVGEDGATLSGGQKQRIAIARAILKDAPILLLDEATSALDNESEKLVQRALEKLMANKTSLIIAHRLSTVEHADLIIVISEGHIIEQGSHLALLEKSDSMYAQLYNTQLLAK